MFDARELFRALHAHEVAYVTNGGVAVQAHGGQRMTQDLDVAVASARENFESLAGALSELDARILGPDGRRSDSTPGATLLASGDQWHLVTRHGRLDVMTVPVRLGSFEEMRGRAHEVPMDDFIVPVASRRDLLVLKRAAGRAQDLADIELLESLDQDEGAAGPA